MAKNMGHDIKHLGYLFYYYQTNFTYTIYILNDRPLLDWSLCFTRFDPHPFLVLDLYLFMLYIFNARICYLSCLTIADACQGNLSPMVGIPFVRHLAFEVGYGSNLTGGTFLPCFLKWMIAAYPPNNPKK